MFRLLVEIILGIYFIWIIAATRKYKKAENAFLNDYLAGEALNNWLSASPNIRTVDSNYSRLLVERKIVTYDEFLKTHPYVRRDEVHCKYLDSLLKPGASPPPKIQSHPYLLEPPSAPTNKIKRGPFKIITGRVLEIEEKIIAARKNEREICAEAVCSACRAGIKLNERIDNTFFHKDTFNGVQMAEELNCAAEAIWKLPKPDRKRPTPHKERCG